MYELYSRRVTLASHWNRWQESSKTHNVTSYQVAEKRVEAPFRAACAGLKPAATTRDPRGCALNCRLDGVFQQPPNLAPLLILLEKPGKAAPMSDLGTPVESIGLQKPENRGATIR